MMTGFIVYLSIGACIAIGGFIYQYSPKSKFGRELEKILYPKRSFKDEVKEALVIPAALVGITLGWPIFIYMVFEGAWYKRVNTDPLSEEKKFATQDMYLKSKVSIEEAESRALYQDPENATPAIPFGHLHKGWVTFIEQIQMEDELWSFLIPKGSLVGRYGSETQADMHGYSIVRNGKTIDEFIYEGSGAY